MLGQRPLLLEIANCPIVAELRRNPTRPHPCQKIVHSQGSAIFQLPEPWVGRIDSAPILFVSSNPSMDEEEQFPSNQESEWPTDRVADFFDGRFTSSAGWVKNYKVLLKNGKYAKRKVRFWLSARQRVSKMLDKAAEEVRPGIDFAITEVVHCKSRSEQGVREASCFCRKQYLERIVEMTIAKIIVVYGSVVREAMERSFPGETVLTIGERIAGPHTLFGISRMMAFLPHPAAWCGGKSFEEPELLAIRNHLTSK